MNVAKELAVLERMTPKQLRAKYEEVFGEECRSNHKQWLIKRIIWRLQANAEGDLSERARQRAAELANDADLRVKAPRERKTSNAGDRTRSVKKKFKPATILLPLMTLEREYKGRTIRVKVRTDGLFECEGENYKSLSAVAKAVTGKHWNGFHFFGLRKNGGDQ